MAVLKKFALKEKYGNHFSFLVVLGFDLSLVLAQQALYHLSHISRPKVTISIILT
jgi:hypothetical protein